MPHNRSKCCFSGCSNSQAKYPDLHFFKFPVKRKEVCEAWLLNCANEDLDGRPYNSLANKVVCGKHFTRDAFTNDMRVRLTLTAVPTLLSLDMEQPKEKTTETPVTSGSTTETPVVSVSATEAPVASVSVTETPMASVSATETPMASVSATETPMASVSATETPMASVSATETPMASVSATETPMASVSATESPVASVSATETPVVSVSATESPVASVSATETPVVSVSVTESHDNLPSLESNISSPQCSCKFPTDDRVLHAWIAATGKPNFVPNDFSKICRLHFADSDYIRPKLLKANAVPTKNLGTNSKRTSDSNEVSLKECNNIIESPVLSTILNQQCDMSKIQVVQQNHSVNLPSTTCIPATVMRGPQLPHLVVPNGNLLFSVGPTITGNPIQLNPIPLSIPVSLVQVQGMGGVGQHAQLVTVQPSQTINYALQSTSITQQTHSVTSVVATKTITSHPDCSLGAIKVVDVNKLLQPPAKEREESLPVKSIQITDSSSSKEEKSSSPEGLKYPAIEPSKDPSKITVSHVLKCLKAILPTNFDLSRLVHNEKVSKLIIRYLKLPDSVSSQTVIKSHLEIIIRASKSEIKVFGDFNKHPYYKIKPLALKVALTQLLPIDFYMEEVTDSLLNCLCVILNQHIYTDGFSILREKIYKFSKEFSCLDDQEELVNKQNSTDEAKTVKNDSEDDVCIIEHPVDESKDTQDIKIAKEFTSPSEESSNENDSKRYRKVTVKRKSYYVGTEDDHTEDPDYDPVCEEEPRVVSTVKEPGKNKIQKSRSCIFGESDPSDYFSDVLNYLKAKNCTAQDVLVNFKLMFHLCRYLNIKSKQSNLVKLKAILRKIIGENINLSNVGNSKKQTIKQKKSPGIGGPLGVIDKLKMKPVVVLKKENLFTDYNEECYYASKNKQQVLKTKRTIRHINGENFSPLKKIDSTIKYTSEHVRKLTDESYKMFRRIILKKNNNRAIFRLKYKELQRGQKVFVKDFHRMWIGYLQGTIVRRNGPISYSVILESGEKRNCTVDHLRPVFGPQSSPRTQRLIKPKQLFDL